LALLTTHAPGPLKTADRTIQGFESFLAVTF
jgi:hypothetical protein